MKSLLRWGTALMTVGGTIFGALTMPGLQALALTQAEVEQQLRGIPVFTITDPEGNPFVAIVPNQPEDGTTAETPEDQGNTIITEVFISPEDAEASLAAFQQVNPELGGEAQVTPVSLALIYRAALESQSSPNKLEFYFVPMEEEVAYAISLVPEEEETSVGVPLFMVSRADEAAMDDGAAADEEVTLLTLQVGQEEIVPLFFTREQFEAAIASVGENDPTFQENLQVDVVWLGDYIRQLELSESEGIQQYRMIPLTESLNFVESFQPVPPEASTTGEPDATIDVPAEAVPDTAPTSEGAATEEVPAELAPAEAAPAE